MSAMAARLEVTDHALVCFIMLIGFRVDYFLATDYHPILMRKMNA
jgi:hypothetical protein